MLWIVGASGGMGHALVNDLHRDHTILATYRSHEPAPEVSERATWVKADVASSEDLEEVASKVPADEDLVLVNLAGISLNAMGHKMSDAVWSQVVETNLAGTFRACRAALPHMRERGWGRIINITSIVGQIGVPGTVAYSASKAGITGLTRTLASENAARGITVNALALGYFSVGMIETIPPDLQESIRAQIPMKRLGDPANVAAAIRFLEAADYVTGATIRINGGLLM